MTDQTLNKFRCLCYIKDISGCPFIIRGSHNQTTIAIIINLCDVKYLTIDYEVGFPDLCFGPSILYRWKLRDLLKPIKVGKSAALRVGQQWLAIGNLVLITLLQLVL